ncbi:TetR/AcrR family transcriptional regulator [Kineococcus rhizosphaerae]|uniref:TetR family transcriptional regulator n=1 Tax=Kineococcus rhizosphaerae TaxID=559628 RepID=A0A2T0QXN3_9ACTN|nr:TetR/AcrR family transcriptional regulator [Kineococcus rhizosphaerae]PRY10740.1 TetR family transcriptional regulator [Kineococcus rhizosphaerae]
MATTLATTDGRTATDSRTSTRTTLLDAAQRTFAHKGFSGVGINEVLAGAGVPKGSFYHYFSSKDAFGEAVLEHYYAQYLADMDVVLSRPDTTWAQRTLDYFESWRLTQSLDDCQGRCLAVKLGAEVADMSEAMRERLKAGTTGIVNRLESALRGGLEDGTVTLQDEPRAVAQSLYELWMGASVLAKVYRNLSSMDNAMATTRRLIGA